ncbi:MAG: CehA/McbA family metallohydrolase [Polyangiaceae bacterium]
MIEPLRIPRLTKLLSLVGAGAATWVACQPPAPAKDPIVAPAATSSLRVAGFELGAAPSPAGELRAGYRLAPAGSAARAVYLMPVLEVDGREARLERIRTDRGPDELGFTQRSEQCELISVVRVRAGSPSLELTLEARCSMQHRARVGWRVDWPGRQSFVPGLGFASRGRATALWVGRQTEQGALALASRHPATMDLVADHVGHRGAVAWSQPQQLPANSRWTEQHELVVGATSLAEAARHAWQFASEALGRVQGRLEPPPEWAVVEARNQANQLVLSSRVAKDGTWRISLPPGNYRVLSRTPGGSDELATSVSAGGDATLNLVPPTPGQAELVAVDDHGAPLATRWILRGVDQTPDPVLGAESALNAGMLFALHGAARASLPPGDYQFTATHGPEYGLFQRRVRVEAGKGVVVRARLPKQLDLKGWVPSDFHLHQAPSFDSEVKLEDRLTALLADGIRFAAATDHNVVTDYADTLRTLSPNADLRTAPGVEITTREWGHFNAFPYGLKKAPEVKDRTPEQIFSAVRHDQPHAILQVNHPRMGDIGYFNRGKLDLATGGAEPGFSYDFDTVEVFNGFDLGNPWAIQQNLESWFGLLDNGWRFTAVGNSDSHKLVGEYAGYPRTYVAVPEGTAVTQEAIVAALGAGHVWVSNGPSLLVELNGAGPGSLTKLSAGNRLQVEIGCADFVGVNRLELIVNGAKVFERAFSEPISGRTQQLELPLELVEDAWVVVIVRGDQALESILPRIDAKPLAFTNPIFVDVDGDGLFRARHAAVREARERQVPSD